jgi:Protein of unknown function (DUF1800)
VLQTLFSSRAFFESSGKIIKSPLEFIVGTFCNFGLEPLEPEGYQRVFEALGDLGQRPFDPPDVSGWPGGKNWLNDSTLLSRIFLARLWTRGKALALPDLSPEHLNLILFGHNPTVLEPSLSKTTYIERMFLLLSSPEYMLS